MKKKILILGIILALIIMLVGLTGCGEQKQQQEENKNQNSSESSKEPTEQIGVKEVKATSKNYAVVKGNDNSQYIVDKQGNVQGTIDNITDLDVIINDNGYVTVYDSSRKTVYDKTGNEIVSGNFAAGVTDDGWILKSNRESNFSGGDSIKYVAVNVDGTEKETSIDSSKYYSWSYLGNDIYSCDGTGSYGQRYVTALYNIKTDKLKEVKNVYYSKDSLAIFDDNILVGFTMTDYSEDAVSGKNYKVAINNELEFMKYSKTFLNADGDYCDGTAIYNKDGKEIKDLTDGNGVKSIIFKNDKYCIASMTEFYYVLDKNINTIKEPVKLGKIIQEVTEYGVLARNENDGTDLYDLDGNLKESFGTYLASGDITNFIAKAYEPYGNIKYFSLDTGKEFVIYK